MVSIIFLLLLILSVLIFYVFKQRKHLDVLSETIEELKDSQEINEIKSSLTGRDLERIRIAKDWHDGIGNSLSTLRLLFDTIQTKNQERYIEIIALLEATQQEFRQIIDDELINSFSNEQAIRNCFEQWRRRFDLGNIRLYSKVYDLNNYERVPIRVKVHLYRMTQELLTNALKYSAATIIKVELKMAKKGLHLSVSDNGKGSTKALVLRNVKERLQSLDGRIEIETGERKGTVICLFIPS